MPLIILQVLLSYYHVKTGIWADLELANDNGVIVSAHLFASQYTRRFAFGF